MEGKERRKWRRTSNVSGGVLLRKPSLPVCLPACRGGSCMRREARSSRLSGGRLIGTKWEFVPSRLTGSGCRLWVDGKHRLSQDQTQRQRIRWKKNLFQFEKSNLAQDSLCETETAERGIMPELKRQVRALTLNKSEEKYPHKCCENLPGAVDGIQVLIQRIRQEIESKVTKKKSHSERKANKKLKLE